jgi:DMSO reductase anchor subunit
MTIIGFLLTALLVGTVFLGAVYIFFAIAYYLLIAVFCILALAGVVWGVYQLFHGKKTRELEERMEAVDDSVEESDSSTAQLVSWVQRDK